MRCNAIERAYSNVRANLSGAVVPLISLWVPWSPEVGGEGREGGDSLAPPSGELGSDVGDGRRSCMRPFCRGDGNANAAVPARGYDAQEGETGDTGGDMQDN